MFFERGFLFFLLRFKEQHDSEEDDARSRRVERVKKTDKDADKDKAHGAEGGEDGKNNSQCFIHGYTSQKNYTIKQRKRQ